MSAIIVPETMPFLVKMLGGRWPNGRGSYRMTWGEMTFGRGIALELCSFEEHFSLHVHLLWVNLYILLPMLQRWHREPRDMLDSWGFSWTADMGLFLRWGYGRTKIIVMPWRDWVQTAHDVRRDDGSWAPFVGSWEHGSEPDGRHTESHPYRYLLRSGEVQHRTATIHVERRTRKLCWLRWLPWGKTSYAIDVEFNDEVGERSGSWKGGCIGCSYELRVNETPLHCLRRMEAERKF